MEILCRLYSRICCIGTFACARMVWSSDAEEEAIYFECCSGGADRLNSDVGRPITLSRLAMAKTQGLAACSRISR